MRYSKWVVASTFAASLIGTSTVAFAQPVVKLRLGHVTSAVSIAGQGAKAFAEAAKELSKGQVEIELFPNSQLGGELEMLSQVRLGTLDIAMNGSGIVAAIEPMFSVTELPFIWKNRDAAWNTLTGPVGTRLLASLEPKGIKGLSWGVWDFRGFLMNGTPISTPADMKGKKIRVIENALYVRTIQSLGANPVPMAWPEVYTGLQQRTIDGVETNYHGMSDSKLYEVGKNLAISDHIFTATVYLMNMKKFQSLSPAHQDVVLKAARAAGETMRKGAAKANEDAIQIMEKNGVKVTRPDRAAFETSTAPVIKYFSTIVGADLVNDVIAAQK
jgi:tripartite ATP-independent transporter DctP family solute receptor